MNTGAPTTASTTPTWTSPGRAITRPSTSATSSERAAEHRRVREHPALVGPVIARATCGTVRPRNEIGPAAAVAAPHSRVTATAPRDPRAADVRAERARRVVAQRERVERAGQRERDQQPEHDERQRPPELVRPRPVSAPTDQKL